MKSRIRFARPLFLLLFAAAALCFFFLGRSTAPAPEPLPEETIPSLESAPAITVDNSRYLQLEGEENPDAESSRYYPAGEDLSSALSLYYLDMENVRILLDAQCVFLEDALAAGLVSPEDLFTWARLDAGQGNCTLYAGIRSGSPYCVFRYPEYDLRFTDGVKPGSNRGGERIRKLYICPNPSAPEVPGNDAQENWGLTFEVQSADSTGIALQCTQSGGQVLDSLIVERYYISTPDFSDSFPRQDGGQDTSAFEPFPAISRNAQTQIDLDWSAIYGDIPPGEYILNLKVTQVYDPENRTADQAAFTALQSYLIPFTIAG